MSSERADQFECTAKIIDTTPDAVIVSNLGVASYVLAGVKDRPRNVYLWGSMGVTTPVGLGLAVATSGPVTVLDGDGSMLMSLGCLATVASIDPPNLTIVIMDNAVYETTGGQPTPAETTEFAGVARECGLNAASVTTVEDLAAAYQAAQAHDGTTVIACAVEAIDPPARPPLDFAFIKKRVRDALADGTPSGTNDT